MISVLLGCGAGERPSSGAQATAAIPSGAVTRGEQASSDSPKVGELVVIAEEADLFAGPDDRGLRFAVPLNRATDPTPGHVVEVVGIEGDFIAVETHDPGLAPACAGSFGIESALELRFWVTRGSLRTVLSHPVRIASKDGSSVALVPGVPISRFEDRVSAHVGGLKLQIDLDDAQLRHAEALGFMPAPPDDGPPITWSLGTIPWPEATELRYGERSVRSRGGVFTLAVAQRPSGEAGDDALLSFVNPCGRFELLAQPGPREVESGPKPPINMDKARRAAGISPLQADTPEAACVRWDLAANTPLEWVDGSPAGHARARFSMSRAPVAPAPEDRGRVCFDAVPGLAVCSDAVAVTRHVEPNCE
ncbi:hypothetical protein DB30_03419 [Enhygromyxa salina]|uniref:Uncharacterized protein n=1 Tax=Enhygromyxa salina TaxID=215803 RepID=A0A0C2DCC1_9BACT|nr:hypothetical protein [Enhygromyxa salina]KIG17362.1 hypothetical protein DB30_03419 [Enhygromyxa salina]